MILSLIFVFFFFNDTATTEIYTLSLHDALPICSMHREGTARVARKGLAQPSPADRCARSEEHTSELQSQSNLVCRLLLEKKKKTPYYCLSCVLIGLVLGPLADVDDISASVARLL